MSKLGDPDVVIKLTNRVRRGVKAACMVVGWAAKPANPMEVLEWVESIEITEVKVARVGFRLIDEDQKEAGIKLTDECYIKVHFEIDGDKNKPFLVEVALAKTHRAGWVPIRYRSGVPARWFQIHFGVDYAGVDLSQLTLINSQKELEEQAHSLGLFQFPYRDIPAADNC